MKRKFLLFAIILNLLVIIYRIVDLKIAEHKGETKWGLVVSKNWSRYFYQVTYLPLKHKDEIVEWKFKKLPYHYEYLSPKEYDEIKIENKYKITKIDSSPTEYIIGKLNIYRLIHRNLIYLHSLVILTLIYAFLLKTYKEPENIEIEKKNS
ncbi:hypothetical protein LNTAR_04131 [Lentisphaera araneosa HTCC2155]|uniref:Uncharacterized protein n=1 Tax=Lentisphaera araneosa HTCC2155 TaxID=313628 RepID=A6DTX2_9BACT|nr:hypothetical protein [Lentisphaera araneosa]EDM24888.1 hypothetical protein LNTAR_04131 [Lentisphaera araneosa HTCC2155]